MRIKSLEVEQFKGIGKATISFGAGLNVLYGPNELGKSTLAEAIRAALFVPTTSKDGGSYVRWGTLSPAKVTLLFEHEGKLWKVVKRFGPQPRAVLEKSETVDAPVFLTVAEGSNVEGKLRELLAWGIASPGGKGAPPKPVSFLHTALLGRQGEVDAIFATGLNEDKDDNGKALVTRALGALAKDPVVAAITAKLAARVEKAFTAGGQLKKAADSPLVKLQEGLKKAQATLDSLRSAHAAGESIRTRVVKCQAERFASLAEEEEAASALVAAESAEGIAEKRANLEQVISGLDAQLADAVRQEEELAALNERLAEAAAERERRAADEKRAADVVSAASADLQSAKEAVAHARAASAGASDVAKAGRQARVAKLEATKANLAARIAQLRALEEDVQRLAVLTADLAGVQADIAEATEQMAVAERELQRAILSEALQDFEARGEEIAQLGLKRDEAQAHLQEAEARYRAAEAVRVAAVAARDRCEGEADAAEIAAAKAERERLAGIEYWLHMEVTRVDVERMEAAEARALGLRKEAAAKRAKASRLESEMANQPLPSRQQVESWRALENALATPVSAGGPGASGILPMGIGALAGVLIAGLLIAAFDQSVSVGIGSGVLAAVVAWLSLRSKHTSGVGIDVAARERRRVRQERWETEVVPALSAAGLPSLGAWEEARDAATRRKETVAGLRAEADDMDKLAASAERDAAGLEAGRTSLASQKRDAPAVDPAALLAWRDAHGTDASAVQAEIHRIDGRIEEARRLLRHEADHALNEAEQAGIDLKGKVDACKVELAMVVAKAAVVSQGFDPLELVRLREQLDACGGPVAPTESRAEATARRDAAKKRELVAVERARLLEQQVEQLRGRGQAGAVSSDSCAKERQEAETEASMVQRELDGLQVTATDASEVSLAELEAATQRQRDLESNLVEGQQKLDQVAALRKETDAAISELQNQIAARRGALATVDRVTIERQRDQAVLEFVDLEPPAPGPSAADARDRLARARRIREQCATEYNQAKGQLQVIAGNVGAEELERQEELVTYMAAEVAQQEADERAAYRLLREIELAEEEESTHLGRALAGPVVERFRRLTDGRYTGLDMGIDLQTHQVEVAGETKELSSISVGTREQLATLIRLAIAEHLETAVVLDDQLVHSDTARLAWFRATLAQSALVHQVLVFTCRAGDYLGEATEGQHAHVVDLATVVS